MPAFLPEDTLASTLADLTRRLQVLESASRVGLNRVRFAWQTANADTTTYDPTWDNGTVGNTWDDDAGGTGTGFPQVTVETGRRALVIVVGNALEIANDVNYRTFAWRLGVGIDGADPQGTEPVWSVAQTHGPTTEGNNFVQGIFTTKALTPGSHTFKVRAKWTSSNPGAPNIPALANSSLIVLPLD